MNRHHGRTGRLAGGVEFVEDIADPHRVVGVPDLHNGDFSNSPGPAGLGRWRGGVRTSGMRPYVTRLIEY